MITNGLARDPPQHARSIHYLMHLKRRPVKGERAEANLSRPNKMYGLWSQDVIASISRFQGNGRPRCRIERVILFQ